MNLAKRHHGCGHYKTRGVKAFEKGNAQGRGKALLKKKYSIK